MKYLSIILILSLSGCSTPVDGLWVEKNDIALLKFYKDSVISNSLETTGFRDTFGYILTKDSVSWTGLNPEVNHGKTQRSFKYLLTGDSLQIWYKPTDKFVYIKSSADNYLDHFLTKGGIKIKLPTTEYARQPLRKYEPLNIRIGFREDKVKIFVQDQETEIYELDGAIKKFKNRDNLNETWSPEIICQLFIDENVTCEYMFWLFDNLRTNDIRRIIFVTLVKDYDNNTSDFWGLNYYLPEYKLNIVEEKNER